MRENRTYGSEGGKRHLFPTPIRNRSHGKRHCSILRLLLAHREVG